MFIPWGDRRHLVSDLMNRFYILQKLFIAALRQCRAVNVAGRVPLQQGVLPGIFFSGRFGHRKATSTSAAQHDKYLKTSTPQ